MLSCRSHRNPREGVDGLMAMLGPYALAAAMAYLLGAIPTGYLVVRSQRNVDILKYGSGRTGTTNVLRTLGLRAAAIVFAGDLAKGIAAVLAARLVSHGDANVETLAGLMAILGHTYSVFIGFKGGRGVATGVGALLAMAPVAGLIAAAVAFSTMGVTRYVSLGSILGAASAPISAGVMVLAYGEPPARFLYAVIAALFVIASHKDNIGRLLKGTERKLGDHVRV